VVENSSFQRTFDWTATPLPKANRCDAGLVQTGTGLSEVSVMASS
jgi:hypothetical protein